MDRDTLENQLFEWEGWDQDGPMDLQFSDITLKQQVGEFPAGTKLKAAFFVGSAALLILMDQDEKQHAFDLKITVGDKVDLEALSCGDACGCEHDH